MAKLGYGYGSEFQLLRFMGRHRQMLEAEIRSQIHEEGEFCWLDFGFNTSEENFIGDEERSGLAFLDELSFVDEAQITAIRGEISAQGVARMVARQSWDAIFTKDDTVYLVEAKAHCKEMITTERNCSTNAEILSFMKNLLPHIEVSEAWAGDYYQLANRLATTALLNKHGIKAKTLCLFFTNGYNKRAIVNGNIQSLCNKNTTREEFETAISLEMHTLSITPESVAHLLTPPVFIDALGNITIR